ncbi:MAG: endopeptidase La [Deltaproteobacteria bacterium]|nr:MAG: endopeptidase La [Deltaproteobacteria bacterium]
MEYSEVPQEYILPLLPLREVVLFPYMIVPLFVGRDMSVRALEVATEREGGRLMFATQKEAKIVSPMPGDIYSVGTIGTIVQMLKLPDGSVKVLVEGQQRARIAEFLRKDDYFAVRARNIPKNHIVSPEVLALIRSVKGNFERLAKLKKGIPSEIVEALRDMEDPERISDSLVGHLDLKLEKKQKFLEEPSPLIRLEMLLENIQAEIEIIHVERKINRRIKKQVEQTQKEFYLNEQMRAIQKELGEKGDYLNEIRELEEKINKKKMSKEAVARAKEELKKLKLMPPMSAEASVVRNYIDWILSLPWYEYTRDKIDIDESMRILDEDHYGLKEVKERIVEYLAVQKLVGKVQGHILCFVGPPGVGKTSLAKSIARSMGRKFVRLSLGGVRDEAEIRGHRRTYVGALPGKIIQSMKKVGSGNPVFLLDEVDKMSTDFRGDPSSALLEVLDPEQNNTFNDHYLDLDYDLSHVMFITTANYLPAIPPPLRDRMEIIKMAGYTEVEKLQIAKRHLVEKQIERTGLKGKGIQFTDAAILRIIRQYTREAGVRNLEREIASILRKVAKEVVRNDTFPSLKITSRNIPKYLGTPKFRHEKGEKEDRIGIAKGLAWTEVGGELLIIEVTTLPGRGKLTVTGKLGDIMQESAQAAVSYIRSRADELGLKKNFYQKLDIHIHIPEGATPKDGPSAGITMATALASALVQKPVRSCLAMTGEITLRGRVLPIGGLKEKILAAHRAGITDILIPSENEKDLKEIPNRILKALNVHLVEHMDEVLKKAIVGHEFITLEEEPSVTADRLFRGNYPEQSPMISPS